MFYTFSHFFYNVGVLNIAFVFVGLYYCWLFSVDLYGGDQTISVSIGSEEELKKKQKVSF